MKIKAVRVQNYKSVLDSGWVTVEDDFTTFVGANEAGKTNFLEAISRFKDGEPVQHSEISRYKNEQDYNKPEVPIVSLKISNLPGRMFEPVQTIYRDPNSKIKPIEPGNEVIKVIRYADGSIRLPPNYIQKHIDSREESDEPTEVFRRRLHHLISNRQRHQTSPKTLEIMNEVRGKRKNEQDIGSTIEKIDEELNNLNYNPSSDEDRTQSKDGNLLYTIRGYLRAISQTRVLRELIRSELSVLPDFRMFSNINPIPEGANHDELQPGNSYFELLNGMGMDEESLRGESLYSSLTRRDTVNERITSQFNDNWDQADVRFELQSINRQVTLRIFEEDDDSGLEVKTLPSERSQGFRWYLAFFCHLIAHEEGEITDSVILLDDPGAYLHPEGHKDLKKALSVLAKDNQILYSTHSPYMIDKSRLDSVRLVRHNRKKTNSKTDSQILEDNQKEELGTNVTRLRGADSPLDDSLEAVRMALGASFSDSLFASKNTILVEGPEDRIYIKRMSELLGDEEALLEEDVNFIDCGGANKADYLARIVDSEDYNAAVILDDDGSGRTARKKLDDIDVDVHHTGGYTEVDDKTTIEDLFSDDLICEIAGDVHSEATEEQFQERANPDHGELADKLNGVLKGIIDDEDPPRWVLDKMEIARTIDNRAEKEGRDLFKQGTLDRFDELIKDINASLNPSEIGKSDSEAEAKATDD